MALPDWLAEELARREDGITGWDSMDPTFAGPDGSNQLPGSGVLPPAAEPYQTKGNR